MSDWRDDPDYQRGMTILQLIVWSPVFLLLAVIIAMRLA
jgi:hypothetical protein